MTRTVAVVGGGAIGVISALELARNGHAVTLFDTGEPGGDQAASYGNGGFLSIQSVLPSSAPGMWKSVPGYLLDPLGPLAIRPAYFLRVWPWLLRYLMAGWTKARVRATATALNTLLTDAPALHAALADEAGCAGLIERKGLLHVFRTRAAYEAEAFGWEVRRDLGIRCEELGGDELRVRHPQLPPIYDFAVFIPDAGRCLDPGAYVARLAELAQSRGVTLRREKVLSLTQGDNGRVAVATASGAQFFDRAVVAAGARSRGLARSLGDRIPLESERGYHVSVADTKTDYGTAFMATDAKAVVNGMDGFVRIAGQVEFAGVDAKPNWKRAEILRRHLARLYPDLDTSTARTWLGHRPSLPDGLPCIGPSPRAPSVIYAFGHAHTGLVGSARTGRLVAQLISGTAPEIDLAPFSPTRFH